MTVYLFTQRKNGKIGNTAHLSYDGENPLCKKGPASFGEFVQDNDRTPVYVCGICYKIAYEGDWSQHSEDRRME